MKISIALSLLFISGLVTSQTVTPAAAPASGGQGLDMNIILIILAVFLLFPISSLANAFVAAAKKKMDERIKSGSLKVLIPLGLLLLSQVVQAQTVSATPAAAGNGMNSQTMTIVLLCGIGLELVIMVFLAFRISDLIRSPEPKSVHEMQDSAFMARMKRIWSKLNFRPIEEEADIDLGHNYDGIRELDNVIPPWFTTAFLLTILFAAGYLYRYHIAKAAPMQVEELRIATAKADLEHEAYLATQSNSIDENNVTIMTGADLEAGKKIFTTICAACHRADGGGQVGPNLTDDYWIHGGSIKNVFTTIKYGVPDKGMISWKTQLTPTQMAQAANYVLTLKGTNPPDPKEKQGTLYIPEPVKADSTSAPSTKADTTARK
jgi:cytochrome c oxidase cbb3-type subunit III